MRSLLVTLMTLKHRTYSSIWPYLLLTNPTMSYTKSCSVIRVASGSVLTKVFSNESFRHFIHQPWAVILVFRPFTTRSNSCSHGLVSSHRFISLCLLARLVSKLSPTVHATRDCCNHFPFHQWHGKAFPWTLLKGSHHLVARIASWWW